ncbi:MAG: DUF418 domain-containing protein [Candidatus Hydrogenedentota bacterium]
MNTRVIGFDLARALAIFGMVLVNFKVVMGASTNGSDWLIFTMGLLDGRAAATFVVLAGIGISLLSKSARDSGDPVRLRQTRTTLLKRALFLFVLGSLYTSIWPADILHFYGIYIAIAAFLFAAPTRRLWAIAVSLTFGFVVLVLTLDYEKGWDFETLEYAGLWTPSGMIRHLFFNGFHPTIPWLAFLLVGIILGRLNWNNSEMRRRIFVIGASVALITEATSAALVAVVSPGSTGEELEIITALFGTAPMPPMPQYILAGTGTACALIAVCVSIGQRFPDAAWLRPFVSTGQIALTLYVAHVFIGMATLETLGRLEDQPLPFSVLASFLFCAFGVAFAWLWRLRFSRGPIELAMRKITEVNARNTID